MTDRKEDRKWIWHVCGKCNHEVYRLKSEPQSACTECGAIYSGTTSATSNTTTGKAIKGGDLVEIKEYESTRKVNDIPSKIKLDLTT
jgi:hypothetical protein